MSSLSIFSTLEEVIPVSDEDLRAGIGSLAPQIVTEYVFYLRNVERKNRAEKDVAVAEKDVAVAENVRLERKLETLQKEMDRTMKMLNDHDVPACAPPLYNALPDLPAVLNVDDTLVPLAPPLYSVPRTTSTVGAAPQRLPPPNEQHGCLIQAIDGPAAGCALTHNSDRRNNFSYWIHTQQTWLVQNYDRWLVTKCEVNSQDCYKIKALDSSDGSDHVFTVKLESWNSQYAEKKISGVTRMRIKEQLSETGPYRLGVDFGFCEGKIWVNKGCRAVFEVTTNQDPNAGRMLVVLNDKHGDDGRALVHETPHSKANECWMIEYINGSNRRLGCRIRKTQDIHINKYLVSRRQRDEGTFWVDVTEDVEDATLWQIIDQQSESSVINAHGAPPSDPPSASPSAPPSASPSAPLLYDIPPYLPTTSTAGASSSSFQCSTSPEQQGYVIQTIDGPAAGCTLTHNSDERSKVSYWVHTQPPSAQGKYDLWKIKRCEVNSQDCYRIEALDSSDGSDQLLTVKLESWNSQYAEKKISGVTRMRIKEQLSETGPYRLGVDFGFCEGKIWVNKGCRAIFEVTTNQDPNAGRMLVVLNDRHGDDGRAIVHETPHSKANECWMIEYIDNENKSLGCRIRKTQDRQKDKYLVSRRQRDDATFWVDVTEDAADATLWKIDQLGTY
ncbi:uncharacterized protein LOC134817151 [Bolinopsis microptera]|uniref:uncharacterized protein LOC134817151 n=1 Tax=Bolinopsis microptera TaxID=2820187 RepID=UPI00307949C3